MGPYRAEPIPQTIRLLVVADVRMYRESIVNNLSCRGAYEVVGVAASAEEVLGLTTAAQPAVIVLDMASDASLDLVRTIAAHLPGVKTVAFAVGDSEEEIVACADARVAGYVSCDASVDDLVAAIESVVRGDLPVPPRIAAALFQRLTRCATDQRQPPRLALTAREHQVLLLINEGLSNKEIAARLSIEVATVKNHVHSLFTKMQVNTRGQAAARLGASTPSRARRNGALGATHLIV